MPDYPLHKHDHLYLEIARAVASQSHSLRAKVGAVIVSANGSIISHGWNGMPSGMYNGCEAFHSTGDPVPLDYTGDLDAIYTRPEVLHAELNAIGKAAEDGRSLRGATVYTTLSPCMECGKLIHRPGITEVVYRDLYRDPVGIEFLRNRGVRVRQCPPTDANLLP